MASRKQAELRAVDLRHNGFSTRFDVLHKGRLLGEVQPGDPRSA